MTPSSEPGDSPAPSGTEGNPLELAGNDLVEKAVADLARHLGLDQAAVAIVSHDEVFWPDASVGCPLPDMSYAQVVTPGTVTILEAGGESYRYHSQEGHLPFLCDAQIIANAGASAVPSPPVTLDPGE